MTQTKTEDQPRFEVGQLVEIDGALGFWWITQLPKEGGNTYRLFGGRLTRRGPYALTRSIREPQLVEIKNKATMKRAQAVQRAIIETMAEMPKASFRNRTRPKMNSVEKTIQEESDGVQSEGARAQDEGEGG